MIIPGPAGDAGVGTGGPLEEKSGQEESFTVHVPGSTFKITLVWARHKGRPYRTTWI